MPRFTTKDLLINTLLIASGMLLLRIVYLYSDFMIRHRSMLAVAGFWIFGGALIGAGIFRFFNRPLLGGLIFGLLQFIWMATATIYYYSS